MLALHVNPFTRIDVIKDQEVICSIYNSDKRTINIGLEAPKDVEFNRVKLNKANPKYTRKEEKKLLSDSIMKQNRMARLIKGL